MAPVEVDDLVPTEDEIEDAVKKLRRNRSGGPSGMRSEHLKGWLAASNRGKQAAEKGEKKTEGEEVGVKIGKNCGTSPDGVSRGGDGGRGHLADRGINPKGEKVVQGHWASGVDVEGCGGDLTSPAHNHHHLTRLSTWF